MNRLLIRWLFQAMIVAITLMNFGCVETYYARETIRLSKIHDHPELKPGVPKGYAEFWVATSFGMWLKDLEEGPTTCDGWDFLPLQNNEKATPYPDIDGLPVRIGAMKQLAWPGNISLKYRPIADNFSGIRIPMPAGDQNIMISYNTAACPLPDEVAARVKTGEPGWRTYFVGTIPIEENRITVVRLDIRNEGDRLAIHPWVGSTTLPVPDDRDSFDPDPNALAEYLMLLNSPDWGFRWYVARRLGLLGNREAVPALETALTIEEHKDVRNELEKAIRQLQ